MTSQIEKHNAAQASADEIRRAIALLYQPGETIELRCFLRGSAILNGYYKDWNRLAADAIKINTDMQPPLSIYSCLNPCKPETYARRPDSFDRAATGEAVSDGEVLMRRWLLVDCDPIRPKGVSATDQQKAAAMELLQTTYRYLMEQLSLARPIVCDSGNGFHLWLPLDDLPNNAETKQLCKQLLQHLAEHCTHPGAKIDQSTFNASRVCKLPGTIARKGADLPQQPHRQAKLLDIPQRIERFSLEQLQAIVGRPAAPQLAADVSGWDVSALLADRGIEYTETADRSDSGEQWTKYHFACPFSDEHSDGFALMQWENGAVSAKCHHDSCQGKAWPDLKQLWQLPAPGGITAKDIILPQLVMSPVSPVSLVSYIEPPELDRAAFHGPIGQIVLGIQRQTEAAPAAVLSCTLAYVGNAIGRRYFVQLDQPHYPKLYVSLVGATGSGRKGTADVQARRIVDAIDPTYSLLRHTGLTTGEGLLLVLDQHREGIYPRPAIFVEREFAAVLKRAERRGNTLSMFIRDAWDNETLANSTKNEPLRIDDHHVAICAHVTPAELKRLLSNTDVANGFCNRFLWIYCRRDDRRPGVHGFNAQDYQQPIARLQTALKDLKQRYIDAGQQPQQVPFDQQAGELWRDQLYGQLDIDADEDTLLTLMCSRQAQQVARLGLIFALADGQLTIQQPHLQAACAIASYVWDSVDYVLSRAWWGDSGNVHDPAGMADKALQALQDGPKPRSYIMHQVFNRHRTAKEINALRDLLIGQNRLRVEQDGRTEVWHLLQ